MLVHHRYLKTLDENTHNYGYVFDGLYFGKMPKGNGFLSEGIISNDASANSYRYSDYEWKEQKECPAEAQRLMGKSGDAGVYFVLNPFSSSFGNCAGW